MVTCGQDVILSSPLHPPRRQRTVKLLHFTDHTWQSASEHGNERSHQHEVHTAGLLWPGFCQAPWAPVLPAGLATPASHGSPNVTSRVFCRALAQAITLTQSVPGPFCHLETCCCSSLKVFKWHPLQETLLAVSPWVPMALEGLFFPAEVLSPASHCPSPAWLGTESLEGQQCWSSSAPPAQALVARGMWAASADE